MTSRRRGIAYFCGVLDDRAGESAADARRRVRDNAVEFLNRDAGALWPAASMAGGVFDWDVLAGPAGAPPRSASSPSTGGQTSRLRSDTC